MWFYKGLITDVICDSCLAKRPFAFASRPKVRYPPHMKSHSEWMKEALTLGTLAGSRDEVPVGALLVCDGIAIGKGQNRREERRSAMAHAEVLALEDFSLQQKEWRVPPNTTLYVTVEPCLMCTGALLWARVDTIVFGCSDPKNAGLRRIFPAISEGVFDHRFSTVTEGVETEACAGLMRDYFQKKRDKKKSISER